MASPSIDEVRLPEDISRDARRSPDWSTVVVRTRSGFEQRVSELSDPIHTYDIAYGVRTVAQYQALLDFWYARAGQARGFRFKDWGDYTVATTATQNTVQLTTTTFQLARARTSGAVTYTRTIYKPVSGTVRMWNGITEITSGFTVATTTGIVTFSVAPGFVPQWSGDFDVPVRFAQDRLPTIHHDVAYFEIDSVPLVELRG